MALRNGPEAQDKGFPEFESRMDSKMDPRAKEYLKKLTGFLSPEALSQSETPSNRDIATAINKSLDHQVNSQHDLKNNEAVQNKLAEIRDFFSPDAIGDLSTEELLRRYTELQSELDGAIGAVNKTKAQGGEAVAENRRKATELDIKNKSEFARLGGELRELINQAAKEFSEKLLAQRNQARINSEDNQRSEQLFAQYNIEKNWPPGVV